MKRGYAVALGALALSWWPVTEIAAQVGEAPRPAKKRSIMMAKAEPATIILEAQQPEAGSQAPSGRERGDRKPARRGRLRTGGDAL
jgi:hypothetical protein